MAWQFLEIPAFVERLCIVVHGVENHGDEGESLASLPAIPQCLSQQQAAQARTLMFQTDSQPRQNRNRQRSLRQPLRFFRRQVAIGSFIALA